MAITFLSDYGATSSKTAGSSLAKTTSGDAAVGDDIFVLYAGDVGGTSFSVAHGGTADITWSEVGGIINTGNVEVRLFRGAVTSISLGASVGTITVSWTTNVTAKVVSACRVSGAGTIAHQGGATGTPNIVVLSHNAGHTWTTGKLLLIAAGKEDASPPTPRIVSGGVNSEIALTGANTTGQGAASNIGGRMGYYIAATNSQAADEIGYGVAQHDGAGYAIIVNEAEAASAPIPSLVMAPPVQTTRTRR